MRRREREKGDGSYAVVSGRGLIGWKNVNGEGQPTIKKKLKSYPLGKEGFTKGGGG